MVSMENEYLKIAIILRPNDISPPFKYGGCGRVVAPLIEGLMQRGHEVTLFTAKPSTLECEIRQPIGIIEEKYEKDIGETRWAGYSTNVFEDIKRLGATKKGFDIINNHYDPLFFILGRNLETLRLTTLHGIGSEANLQCFNTYPDENFLALSEGQRSMYPKDMNFLGIVYNSISDNHPFSENKREYLFSISRIQPSKGQGNSIYIAKKSKLDLIMAGNSTDEYYFEKEISPYLTKDLSKPNKKVERKNFIENISLYNGNGNSIIYIGEITEKERDQLMKNAKAFLFPIEGEESCPLVVLEAGIVGTPIISIKKRVIPEMIEFGKTGFYGETLEELINFTKRVEEIDPNVCRDHVRKKFNSDKMVDGYINLYRKIIERENSLTIS